MITRGDNFRIAIKKKVLGMITRDDGFRKVVREKLR